ncbi:hypothetical protein TNCV_1675381 [Trichonephila clavipes]|nr:hypothetical protein TNCV_1675381 [Trichonephila clavipes]
MSRIPPPSSVQKHEINKQVFENGGFRKPLAPNIQTAAPTAKKTVPALQKAGVKRPGESQIALSEKKQRINNGISVRRNVENSNNLAKVAGFSERAKREHWVMTVHLKKGLLGRMWPAGHMRPSS